MGRTGLFAYGSLVSPDSAARTLGRPVLDAVPARLAGWQRRWSQARDNLGCEKTFARRSDGSLPRHVLGLNVERAEGTGGPNGVLIEIGERELERLDVREMRYDRVEVTAEVEPWDGRPARFDLVFAYSAKPEHHAPQPLPDSVVLASYVRAVRDAFAALGLEQLELYAETSEPPPVEVAEAVLVRDRIPPGNPREW